MNSKATYPSHPRPTLWSPAVDMFHGIGRSSIGCKCEAIQNRLGFGNDPKEAGR
jgi:hypothetical protein